MELAAQPGEEHQIGDEITAATDPDYGEVRDKALQVLERSHDLRAAVYLGAAVLPSEGIVGFAEVVGYVRGCLERYWDSCHPELDADDDNDPTMRINAVQGLCGQPGGLAGPSPIYAGLRRAALTDSRGFGRFSLRDMEIADGKVPVPAGMKNAPDSATISAAFQDSDEAALAATLQAVTRATEDVTAISAVFDEKTPGRGPDLDPLIKLLGQIARRLKEHVGGAGDATGDGDDDAPEQDETGLPAAAPGGPGGAIRSRADVSGALDRIIGYYRQNEPSSPIPLVLERAKRLVNADFMTIMKDMAPGGVENVQKITGSED
jgi:type VI secretion system protein ImpA